jgi:L-rhamnose mutarotase
VSTSVLPTTSRSATTVPEQDTDYDRAIAELARDPVNVRWQAEVAPLMETARNYTGESADRLPVIFELGR